MEVSLNCSEEIVLRLVCSFSYSIFFFTSSYDNYFGSSIFTIGGAIALFWLDAASFSVSTTSIFFSYSLTILSFSSIGTPSSKAKLSKFSILICLAPIFFFPLPFLGFSGACSTTSVADGIYTFFYSTLF